MIKKNQHYKLIEHVVKEKKAKVYNFKANRIEIYNTILTRKERILQRKKRIRKIQLLRKINSLFYLKFIRFFNLVNKYENCIFLPKNNLFNSLFVRKIYKNYNLSLYSFFNLFYSGYRHKVNRLCLNKYNYSLNIISIYLVLSRNNIYVTLVNDNKQIIKIFSPCLFFHINKKGRKKSISFFYTVKRSILYLRRFINFRKKRYFFKLYLKGFHYLRRLLVLRFFYNKFIKYRCLGIYNLDLEPFNGCRFKKSKRIKIRGQRKQKKRFYL